MKKRFLLSATALLVVLILVLTMVPVFGADGSGKSGSASESETEASCGWIEKDGSWTYLDENGSEYKNGVYEIDSNKYYFDKSGLLRSGFINTGGRLYLFSDSGSSPEQGFGAMEQIKGWKTISGRVYRFNDDHSLATGWKKISGSVFYFASNGRMKTGKTKIGSKTFFFNTSGKPGSKGKLITGFKTTGGKTRYYYPKGKLGSKGRMLTGLKKIKGYKYFFSSSGVLRKNGVVGTKKTGFYYASKSGRIDPKLRAAVTYKGKKYNVICGRAYKVATKKDLTLHRALVITGKITNSKMSLSKKLLVCFRYTQKTYRERNPRVPHYHGSGWVELYANDMFVDGAGNCFSFAAAYAYLAKACGASNVYACNSGGHGWTEINGLVYDAEWDLNHPEVGYYALSYSSPKISNYKPAISAGEWWMHVKV